MRLRLSTVPEIPGYLVITMVLATLVMVVGAYWDFWWHGNIGRDDFWEPPHMVIYSGLMVTAVSALTAVVHNRFKINNILLVLSLSLIGFFVAAPFDDWWHRTYPIPEVGIHGITPPHVLVVICALFLGLGISIILNSYYSANRASRLAKYLIFCYNAGGLSAITFALIILDPYSGDHILGTIGSITFGFFMPAYLISNEMFYKERGLITKLAIVSSILRVLATSNLSYAFMTVIAAAFVDLWSAKLQKFGRIKHAMAAAFIFTSLSLALYFPIQTQLIGIIGLNDLTARYLLANCSAILGGVFAYRLNKIALKILMQ